MGFNCAQEKAKFDREWLRLRKEYTDAGMSETAIQKIYEYDWYCFCRNRAYERRATQMPSLEIDSPDDERRSALFRKNEALSTSFDESAFPDRYAWVDTLEDERLLRAIIKLNKKGFRIAYLCYARRTWSRRTCAKMGVYAGGSCYPYEKN